MNAEQIKAMLQMALGAGGPLVALLLSYGVPADKLNLWINVVVAFVPPIGAAVWALVERKHKNQIAAVAAIPGVDEVKINPTAKDGAAAAAADPALPTVKVQSPWWISLILVFVLAACATEGPVTRDTLLSRLDTVRTGSMIAGLTVAAYAALPPCTDRVTVGCSNPVAVTKMESALSVLNIGIDAAQVAIESEATSMTDKQKALAITQASLSALTQILKEYRAARGQ